MTDLERANYKAMDFAQLCRCDPLRINDRTERLAHQAVIAEEMRLKRNVESARQRGYPHANDGGDTWRSTL